MPVPAASKAQPSRAKNKIYAYKNRPKKYRLSESRLKIGTSDRFGDYAWYCTKSIVALNSNVLESYVKNIDISIMTFYDSFLVLRTKKEIVLQIDIIYTLKYKIIITMHMVSACLPWAQAFLKK